MASIATQTTIELYTSSNNCNENKEEIKKSSNNIENFAQNDSENNSELIKTKPINITLADYCKKTSIHGIQYIGEFKRNPLERCLWLFILLAALFACVLLIGNVFEKWVEKPVLVSLDSRSTPVWKIPFPAITICPNKQFSKEDFDFGKATSSLEENTEISSEMKSNMETIGQSCSTYMELLQKIDSEFFKFHGFNDTIPMPYFLEQFDYFYNKRYNSSAYENAVCKWSDGEYLENCFGKIITEFGICQTFNLLSPKQILREEARHDYQLFHMSELDQNFTGSDWDQNYGFKMNSPKETYPKRALGAGMKNGLEIIFADIKDLGFDTSCKGPMQGFKLVLHSPNELGDISNQFVHISFGDQVLISIKPKIMVATKKLIRYTPEVRQCYFQNERYLRYFKIYNQQNCHMECLANYTLTKCGCVKFHMPRNEETPVCGLPNLQCCLDAEKELTNIEYDNGFMEEFSKDGKHECDCLPGCQSVTYDTEINVAKYDYLKFYVNAKSGGNMSQMEELYKEHKGFSVTNLFVYFKENQFLTSKRSELFGTTDLIAQCGGLLGLFMGFSVISLIEIVYFSTIRFFVNWRNSQ